jgi:hypothetical protein
MSTVLLIIGGLVLLVGLMIGIGYLLDKYGVSSKMKEWVAYLKTNAPKYKRWLITGAFVLLFLIALIVVLIIIF